MRTSDCCYLIEQFVDKVEMVEKVVYPIGRYLAAKDLKGKRKDENQEIDFLKLDDKVKKKFIFFQDYQS